MDLLQEKTVLTKCRAKGKYLCGYVDSLEKVEQFEESIRIHEGQCFFVACKKTLSSRKRKMNFQSRKTNVDAEAETSESAESGDETSEAKTSVTEGEEDKGNKESPGSCNISWMSSRGDIKIPYSGTPFSVQSNVYKGCRFGHMRKKSVQDIDDTINYCSYSKTKKRRFRLQPSIKKGCPAVMQIKKVLFFPEYAFDGGKTNPATHPAKGRSRHHKAIKDKLEDDIISGKAKGLERYYILAPLEDAHENHSLKSASDSINHDIHPDSTESNADFQQSPLPRRQNIKRKRAGLLSALETLKSVAYLSHNDARLDKCTEMTNDTIAFLREDLVTSDSPLIEIPSTCKKAKKLTKSKTSIRLTSDRRSSDFQTLKKYTPPNSSIPQHKRVGEGASMMKDMYKSKTPFTVVPDDPFMKDNQVEIDNEPFTVVPDEPFTTENYKAANVLLCMLNTVEPIFPEPTPAS